MGLILANVRVIFLASQTIPSYKRGNNFNLGVQTTIENPKLIFKKKRINADSIERYTYISFSTLAYQNWLFILLGPSCKMIKQEYCPLEIDSMSVFFVSSKLLASTEPMSKKIYESPRPWRLGKEKKRKNKTASKNYL